MPVPSNVKKQAEEANRLYEKAYGKPGEPAPEGDEDIEAEDQPNPESQEPKAKEPDAQREGKGEPKPAEAKDEPLDDENRDASYWQNRFNVLQGKYNAEVPRLQAEIRRLSAELEASKEAPQSDPQSDPRITASDAMKRLEDEYGPELAGTLRQVIDEQTRPLKDDLERTQRNEQSNAEARYWSELKGLVPDYEQINVDPDFLSWLEGVDQFTGVQRQSLLERAHKAMDSFRVSQFFTAWKQGQRAADPEPAARPEAEPRPSQERKIMPDNRRAAPVQSQDAPTFTRADVKAFYRDKAVGRYTDDEAAAIESQIFAAQRAGTIIN